MPDMAVGAIMPQVSISTSTTIVGDGAEALALHGFGTTGAGVATVGEAMDMAGTDGIVGIAGAGVATAVGAGTTGAGEASMVVTAGPVLGARHTVTITDSTITDTEETLRSIEVEEAFTEIRIQSQAIIQEPCEVAQM